MTFLITKKKLFDTVTMEPIAESGIPNVVTVSNMLCTDDFKNYFTWRWGHRTSLDDGVEVDNNSSSLIRDFNLGTSGKSSLYLTRVNKISYCMS